MKNHPAVIRVGDYAHGHSDPNGGCAWTSTRRAEMGRAPPSSKVDGMFYLINESGTWPRPTPRPGADRSLARAWSTPAQTEIRKKAGRIWTHPVIAGGRLYLRDQDKVYCYDVKCSERRKTRENCEISVQRRFRQPYVQTSCARCGDATSG